MNLSDPRDVHYLYEKTFGEWTPPQHYNGGSSDYYELPLDCSMLQDVIWKKQMGFTQGNIFKAAYRWDTKPDLTYNLEKIKWFAEDALRRIYAEQKQRCLDESQR